MSSRLRIEMSNPVRINEDGRAVLPLVVVLKNGRILDGEYPLAEHMLRLREIQALGDQVVEFAMDDDSAKALRERFQI